MSAHTDAPTDERGRPEEGHLTAFVDDRLFDGAMDTLDRFTGELEAVANPHRYAVLYYVWDRANGDLEQRIPRSELAALSELKEDTGGFQAHMKQLLRADLLAEVPAPDGEDGRKTFYRLTYGGQNLMDALSALHPEPDE